MRCLRALLWVECRRTIEKEGESDLCDWTWEAQSVRSVLSCCSTNMDTVVLIGR